LKLGSKNGLKSRGHIVLDKRTQMGFLLSMLLSTLAKADQQNDSGMSENVRNGLITSGIVFGLLSIFFVLYYIKNKCCDYNPHSVFPDTELRDFRHYGTSTPRREEFEITF
jgi:hypothetical protein